MSAVMHGRRKGQTRYSVTPPQHSNMHLVGTKDFSDVTVFSKADWQRVQDQLNRRQIEQERIRQVKENQELLKAQSKEMVKNWGNTIAGQRNRKLEARKLREEKNEEERVQMDIEEAKYQAQMRKEAIEKAKTQQYYQTDRVKCFHGALLLTEVLKEREAQLELKQLKEKANEGKDQEWLDRDRREYEEGIHRDQEKALQRMKAARDTADFLKAQTLEHEKAKSSEQKHHYTEGDELEKLAVQFEVEKERLEHIRRGERKQLMDDNLRQQADVRRMRELQRKQEEEEDDECRIFATAKRKMMKLRSQKEAQLHREKQEHLEGIREKLTAQMKQKVDNEDDRIIRAVDEKSEKAAEEDAEKDAKQMKQIQEAAEHRYEQMKELERKKKQERREELEIVQIRHAADEIFYRNEEEKRLQKALGNEDMKQAHLTQADERRAKEQEAREQQLALDRANMELLALEEQQFQEYADKVIDHCEQGGRNTYPLRKAAEEGAGGGKGPRFMGKGGMRPSYMVSDKSCKQLPTYQRETTNETRNLINGKNPTKKRLGFVW